MDFSRADCLLIASRGSETSMSLRLSNCSLDSTPSGAERLHLIGTRSPTEPVYDLDCPDRTAASTRSAATPGSSCSQIRTTGHPSSRIGRRSRGLARCCGELRGPPGGVVPRGCLVFGQPCQKQPSTNTATRCAENVRSALLLGIPGIGASTRYRSPRAWSNRRSSNSAVVSLVRCSPCAATYWIEHDRA